MEFDIKKHTSYLTLSGSHAYGLANSESDYDLRGWGIPPKEYFFTYDKKFEQHDQKYSYKKYPFRDQLEKYINKNKFRIPENSEIIDSSIYDIRKFFKLAADCNPNVLEILFVADKNVLIANKFAIKARENFWDLGVITLVGNFTSSFDYTINTVFTTDGIVYIDPTTDETWSYDGLEIEMDETWIIGNERIQITEVNVIV